MTDDRDTVVAVHGGVGRPGWRRQVRTVRRVGYRREHSGPAEERKPDLLFVSATSGGTDAEVIDLW